MAAGGAAGGSATAEKPSAAPPMDMFGDIFEGRWTVLLKYTAALQITHRAICCIRGLIEMVPLLCVRGLCLGSLLINSPHCDRSMLDAGVYVPVGALSAAEVAGLTGAGFTGAEHKEEPAGAGGGVGTGTGTTAKGLFSSLGLASGVGAADGAKGGPSGGPSKEDLLAPVQAALRAQVSGLVPCLAPTLTFGPS